MNRLSTKAIVLTRINFGEADRILTVMTPDYGKMSVLAKGVRKPKSKLAGGLELFGIANILFVQGRSDLKTLVSAHIDQHFGNIVKEIDRTMCAYDVLKFTHNFTQPDCESDYYTLVATTLAALDVFAIPKSVPAVWFGVRLLALSGHGLNLENDSAGAPLASEQRYDYDYSAGALRLERQGYVDARHIKLLRLAGMLTPAKLARITQSDRLTADLEQLLKHSLELSIR